MSGKQSSLQVIWQPLGMLLLLLLLIHTFFLVTLLLSKPETKQNLIDEGFRMTVQHSLWHGGKINTALRLEITSHKLQSPQFL